jgi:hypothetical protein
MRNLLTLILLAGLAANALAAVDPVPPWPTPLRVDAVATWPAAPALTPVVIASVEAPALTPAFTASSAVPLLTPAFTTSVAAPALTTAISTSTAVPVLTPAVTTSVEAPVLATAITASLATPVLTATITTSVAAPVLTPALIVYVAAPQPIPAQVYAGGAEQLAILAGTLTLSTTAITPPAVPAWLEAWYPWADAPTVTQSGMPLVRWSATASVTPPSTPHLLAVDADCTTPLRSLAAYLVADPQAVAVILGWEAVPERGGQPLPVMDTIRFQALAAAVRQARPGLPVWVLIAVPGMDVDPQPAEVLQAAAPDALVVYGFFAPPSWEPARLTANLAQAQALLPGKPVYAAGLLFGGAARDQAVTQAQQAGWNGVLRAALSQ